MDKIEFLQKIKALADDGIDGEKSNAQKLLNKLMGKYGYAIDDITDEHEERCTFKIHPSRKFLFWGIVHNVLNSTESISYYKVGRNEIGLMLSKSQEIIIRSMWDFYLKKLNDERKILFKAFMIKHELYSHAEQPENAKRKPLTQKELELLLKALEMSKSLSDAEYQKRLNA
jgi:hypothetical protein